MEATSRLSQSQNDPQRHTLKTHHWYPAKKNDGKTASEPDAGDRLVKRRPSSWGFENLGAGILPRRRNAPVLMAEYLGHGGLKIFSDCVGAWRKREWC